MPNSRCNSSISVTDPAGPAAAGDKLVQALLLPFDSGGLDMPDRAFLMRGEAAPPLERWRSILTCEQSFRPAFDRLRAAGYDAVERLQGRFPLGLFLLTKHKGESRAGMARAWTLLQPGGTLVCCGANALGAASLEKEAAAAIGLDGKLAKHQSRIFWFSRRGEDMPPALRSWLAEGSPRPVAGCGLVARAGCFSPDHVDPGSRLLADSLPADLAGRGADLGAGWGFLSSEILRRSPSVTTIDLFEAEALALDDARANIADSRASFHWHDVCAGLPETAPYDWIVSNPPFHEGGKADPAIGQAFIRTAWKAIRRRGKFLLVANRHLPYEAELRRCFRDVALIRSEAGFKVYLASNRADRIGGRP
jgi:16S rRNA (guanine1207-N2)-methyltransferase